MTSARRTWRNAQGMMRRCLRSLLMHTYSQLDKFIPGAQSSPVSITIMNAIAKTVIPTLIIASIAKATTEPGMLECMRRPYIVVEEGYSYKHRSCYDYSWVHALSAFIDSVASSLVKRPAAMNSSRCLWAAALAPGPASTAWPGWQGLGPTGKKSSGPLPWSLKKKIFPPHPPKKDPPGD